MAKNYNYRVTCSYLAGTVTATRMLTHMHDQMNAQRITDVGFAFSGVAIGGEFSMGPIPQEAAKAFVAAYFNNPDLHELRVERVE